jgi:TPR repeat protein
MSEEEFIDHLEEYLEKLMEEGDAEELFEWACKFTNGDDVIAADPECATVLMEAAANAGHVTAMYNCALAYAQGIGVEEDMAMCAFWLYAASKNGHARAQYVYACFLIEGQNMAQDIDQGMYWLQKAAEQGEQNAIDMLNKARG